MASLSSCAGKTLEDYLLERHDLADCTKQHYRMAWKAFSKYVADRAREVE